MDLGAPNFTPQIEFRTQPEQQLSPYLADYFKAADLLNKDRIQTRQLDDRGFFEQNPLLGKHPSRSLIDAYFGAYLAAPLIMNKLGLPDWAKSSLADSMSMAEQMVTDQNKRLFDTGKNQGGLPIAAKFTYHGDWDKPLEKHLGLLTSWLNGGVAK